MELGAKVLTNVDNLISASPEEDLDAFRSHFKSRFPSTSFSDYKNGVYSVHTPSREQWESIEEFPHTRDKSGKSTIKGIYFDFISGGYAQSSCYDWSDESQYSDHLRVGIITKEFQDLL